MKSVESLQKLKELGAIAIITNDNTVEIKDAIINAYESEPEEDRFDFEVDEESLKVWLVKSNGSRELDCRGVKDLTEEITAAAKITAQEFVEEYSQPWNEKTDGDWDAVTFNEDLNKILYGCPDELRQQYWIVWSTVFRSETRLLTKTAASIGAKGCAVKSEAKSKASAENGKKGGRPKKSQFSS